MRIALVLCALMFTAAAGAIVARPTQKVADEHGASLVSIVPKEFGGWREVAQAVQMVNPQTQELLDRLYSEILTRSYVNAGGYRVMLSLAYGSDQRGALQAHKPEVCYPAQGFTVHANEPAMLQTAFGEIPARRLYTTLGQRHEPVTYWFTVGDKASPTQVQRRLVQIRFALTGRIPDGMLFRVSSIDLDQKRAYQVQEQFVGALLKAVSRDGRKRLSGLGAEAGA
jgi:EpsI family protein